MAFRSSMVFRPHDSPFRYEIAASLADRGRGIDAEAVMIGATALERDDGVLTQNADHFGRVDGLDVETY